MLPSHWDHSLGSDYAGLFVLGGGRPEENLITVKSPAKCSFHSAINTQQVRVCRVPLSTLSLST